MKKSDLLEVIEIIRKVVRKEVKAALKEELGKKQSSSNGEFGQIMEHAEDECEIILEAMTLENQKINIEKEILKPLKNAPQIKKSDVYFKIDTFINWFDEFQNLDKRIKYLDENINNLFTEWATNVLPNNNFNDKSISIEHLKKLMKLKPIGSNSWFHKDFMQMKVEKGSVEWYFRDKINNLIESEGFVGYFIMSSSSANYSQKFYGKIKTFMTV